MLNLTFISPASVVMVSVCNSDISESFLRVFFKMWLRCYCARAKHNTMAKQWTNFRHGFLLAEMVFQVRVVSYFARDLVQLLHFFLSIAMSMQIRNLRD